MRDLGNFVIVLVIALTCMLPTSIVKAAQPSQVNQITMDDGIISDLGLPFNRDQSFIFYTTTPPQVDFVYGQDGGDQAHISIYFYDYDLATYMSEHSLFYQSNIVERTSTYRIISWETRGDRYAVFYADQPELGDNKYALVEFTDGTTLVSLSATLDADTYSDTALQSMAGKLEDKARELLNIQALSGIHGQIAGFSIPLRHIKVMLSDGQTTNETTTDDEGQYNFTRALSKEGRYTLTVEFSYVLDNTTYFSLHYLEDNRSVISYRRPIIIDSTTDLTQDVAMDQALPQQFNGDWAKTFASMYVHFTEALEFYKDGLEVNVNFQLPLDIYTFASDPTGTRYWYNTPGKSYITIDSDKSIHESVYRPRNREYHEFSHYIMHTMYQQWPAPATDLPITIPERNHDGYLNPSTSDSFVEGFAEFMSAVMLQYYQEESTTIPMVAPDPESMSIFSGLNYLINTQWYGLEWNSVAYGDGGRAEETAAAGVLWDLYDDNTDYCDKTPEQMYQTYQQRLPEIQKEYEAAKASYEETAQEYNDTEPYPPLKTWTVDDFRNYKWDDDNATLGFEKVWNVIKHFNNDFTSVYNEITAMNPSQKKAIDEVFVTHKFYVDTNLGNGVYDPRDIYRDLNHNHQHDADEYYVDFPVEDFNFIIGNVIGPAANYDRLWRQSVQEVPGYFIKVQNKVPFYLVKISFPNQFYLDYIVRAWNDNGLISIRVPPAGYDALITIVPEGVQTDSPLNFSSAAFQLSYDRSVDQGYYVEHDFQISGQIPAYPSMPGSAAVDGSSTIVKTPGFEIIIFIGACIGVVLLMKKRQRHKR